MNWINSTDKTPPFNRYLMLLFGTSEIPHIARIVRDSPNDDDQRSEYRSFQNGEDDYRAYQFYLQPSHNKWMGNIDVDAHGDSDFLTDYSDSITHWAEVPSGPGQDSPAPSDAVDDDTI